MYFSHSWKIKKPTASNCDFKLHNAVTFYYPQNFVKKEGVNPHKIGKNMIIYLTFECDRDTKLHLSLLTKLGPDPERDEQEIAGESLPDLIEC